MQFIINLCFNYNRANNQRNLKETSNMASDPVTRLTDTFQKMVKVQAIIHRLLSITQDQRLDSVELHLDRIIELLDLMEKYSTKR